MKLFRLPSFEGDDFMDCASAYLKERGEVFTSVSTSGEHRAYCVDLFPVQFFACRVWSGFDGLGKRISLSLKKAFVEMMIQAARPALLSRHIFHIVFVRSQEEMIRADARSVIALVQYKKALWNRAIVQRVRELVRSYSFCVLFTAIRKFAVSPIYGSACPEPAIISFINILPESGLRRDRDSGSDPCLVSPSRVLLGAVLTYTEIAKPAKRFSFCRAKIARRLQGEATAAKQYSGERCRHKTLSGWKFFLLLEGFDEFAESGEIAVQVVANIPAQAAQVIEPHRYLVDCRGVVGVNFKVDPIKVDPLKNTEESHHVIGFDFQCFYFVFVGVAAFGVYCVVDADMCPHSFSSWVSDLVSGVQNRQETASAVSLAGVAFTERPTKNRWTQKSRVLSVAVSALGGVLKLREQYTPEGARRNNKFSWKVSL